MDLSNPGNSLVTIGNINREGDLTLIDKGSGLKIFGQLNDGATASDVTIATLGGNLSMGVLANITGAQITLVTPAHFLNYNGPSALNASNWWTIYSLKSSGNLPNGLIASGTIAGVYQYPGLPANNTNANLYIFQK